MEYQVFYTEEELLKLPFLEDIKAPVLNAYTAIMLVPTGTIRKDSGNYPEFAIIGCNIEQFPVHVICYVHAGELDFKSNEPDKEIKFDMVGPNIFRMLSKGHFFSFNLTSSAVMDFELRPIPKTRR